MGNEIKILITSDIHLGNRDESLKLSDKIRLNTFKKIVSLAGDHDFLMIAGDLVDGRNLDRDMLNTINKDFEELRRKNRVILFSPGISEMDDNGNLLPLVSEINTGNTFSNPGKQEHLEFTINNQRLIVYGMPATGDFDILSVKKEPGTGFHMGLFHTDCDFKNIRLEPSPGNPVERTISGLDFYALGRKHNFKMFKVMNKIIGIYPGSPEATGFNEHGDRYVVSISVADDKIINLRRLCVNSISIHSLEIDCSNISAPGELIRTLSEKKSGKTILLLSLTGIKHFIPDDLLLDECRKFFHDLIITDNTIPSVVLLVNRYSGENTIRGEFYRLIKEKLDNKTIPGDLNIDDLSLSLNVLAGDDFASMEDWLCNISNA